MRHSPEAYASLEPLVDEPEHCKTCGAEIKTMSYQGTGACGEIHRKVQAGEDHGEVKALAP